MKISIQSVSYGVVGLCLGGWPAIAAVQTASTPSCPANLGAAIDTILQKPSLQTAYWGILIQSLKAPTVTLYSKNADQLFVPASNVKLFTTAAALAHLTPQFQQQTPVLATGQAPTLQTVRIVGQGDPSFSDRNLEQIAQVLQAKGVRTINTLMGDDSRFQGPMISPSWSWEDLQGGDGLPINSLILNGNVVPLKLIPQNMGQPLRLEWLSQPPPRGLTLQNRSKTVDSSQTEFTAVYRDESQVVVEGQLQIGAEPDTVDVPVPNPGLAFLDRFQAILKTHHIQVHRLSLTTQSAPQPNEVQIAAISFPALSVLLTEANQKSNNLYAEALLRLMGSTKTSENTADQGLTTLMQTLTQLGIDASHYALVDGSGLSRQNLASPRALVETLRAIAQSPHRDIFHSSLAVAGQSGTLRHRFSKTLVQGHLYGKTGTLQGVTALSGYLEIPANAPLIFSVVVNHSVQPALVLRQAVDQIILAVAQPCSKTLRKITPVVQP